MVVLNSLLLFIILFYVYPLKFLFRTFIGFIGSLVGVQFQPVEITPDQMATLFVIFGLGWAAGGAIGLPGLIYLLTVPAQTVIDSWAGARRRALAQHTA